jgi:hypothetical protein
MLACALLAISRVLLQERKGEEQLCQKCKGFGHSSMRTGPTKENNNNNNSNNNNNKKASHSALDSSISRKTPWEKSGYEISMNPPSAMNAPMMLPTTRDCVTNEKMQNEPKPPPARETKRYIIGYLGADTRSPKRNSFERSLSSRRLSRRSRRCSSEFVAGGWTAYEEVDIKHQSTF